MSLRFLPRQARHDRSHDLVWLSDLSHDLVWLRDRLCSVVSVSGNKFTLKETLMNHVIKCSKHDVTCMMNYSMTQNSDVYQIGTV